MGLLQDEVTKAQEALNEQKEKLRACNKDIVQHQGEQQKLHKDINKAELQAQDLQHKVSKVNRDSADASKQVDYFLKSFSLLPH